MTRQPSDQYLDAPGQPANPLPIPTTQSVPQSAPPPQKSADQQTSSSGHVYRSINAVFCSRGQGREDVFVPPPRLTYLDLLIIENSGFPSMAEFEIFLQLYQKSYYHMELAERKKLFQQVELLRQSMRHPQSIQALVEAQQSIQAGQPFLSLKHYANFSRNGYMLTSMISRCLNLTSFALQRAVFKAAVEASRNTDTPNIATISGKSCEDILSRGVKHWTAEDILKLETIVYIRPAEHHVNNPPSKVTSRTDFSYFSHEPPLHCPDPPKYGSMKIEPNDSALSLQQPWTYSQCLDYLAGRTINFMNSRDPEAFFFSLPSDDKLQGMTADQRAEYVRKHIIEQDAKRALSKSGNNWYPIHSKTFKRPIEGTHGSLVPELDTTASISKGGPYTQGTLDNHRNRTAHDICSRGGRHGFETPSSSSADCGGGMGYGRQPPSSIAADDGYCDSDLGDDDDSDWAPTQSDNWSSPSRSTKRVSFAAWVTDIPGNLRGQENSIVPSNSLSFAESESENDQATPEDNGSLSENIRDRQDCLWAASVAHDTSAVEVALASGDENDVIVPVGPPRTSVSKRGNRKRPLPRGRRVAQPRAQRRGGDFDTLLDTLEKYQLQLSSLPKLNNEKLDLWDEMHQKATKKSQGIKAQEVLFPTWEEVPVQRGVSKVGYAPQEDSMLAMQEMLLEQQRKKRIQLLQEQAAMQARLVSKTGPKNDHDLEASAYEPALLTMEQESKNQVELKRQEQVTMPAAYPSWEKAGQTKPVESRASLGNDKTILNGPPKFHGLTSKEAQQFELGQLGKLKNRSALQAPHVGKTSASARAPKDCKQDMATKFGDLKKFADEFKMSTPVPSDIAFINHGPLRIAIKEDNLRRFKGAPFDESNVKVISVEEATRLLAAQKLAKEISTVTKSATGTSPPIPSSHQLNGFDLGVAATAYDQDRFIQATNSSVKNYKANHGIHSFEQDGSMNAKCRSCSERSRLRLRFNDLSGELF
ncbi:hypothetical protein BCON_0221g00080 [Botryotinia convoluta]|uniref:Uncharacterized protein n=1 Tax=Botryotinia convoluta TaxID=54673 RepID=A0A4Z1HJ68_9HELO|nr:hypothetical protein BCON_0221g00080 [Botryotinia convoluta]